MSYIAVNPDVWLGKVVPDGQCVAYVKIAAHAPATGHWKRGALIKDNRSVKSGTAIATFDPNGKYGSHVDGRSHAAIYLSQDKHGLIVVDQWVGQPVHKRVIRFGVPGAKPVNDGNQFYVIE
ncbi:MAG: BPSL0067 family protein [Alphaproteobacteria bacterium]|nr:BPSL0067 family protein [Alphaproteobacteria bacterium]